MRYAPYKPSGGKYPNLFRVSEFQNLPRRVWEMRIQFRDQTRKWNGQGERFVKVFPLAFTHFATHQAFWMVDVIVPQNYGGKICSNARGKSILKLTADTLNHVLPFLKANLLSNWGFECLLKLSYGFMRYAPYKPSGGKYPNLFRVSEFQKLPRSVWEYNLVTRNVNERVKMKGL